MKALLASAEWKPRPGYTPTEREVRDKRAIMGSDLFCDPDLKIVDIPKPVPKDDEVLLKVGGAAVCGSDTMFLGSDDENYTFYCGHCKLPVVIGHEFSGEIIEVGKNVRHFKVGDLVVAETMNWCGECTACRKGLFNQCENLEEIGFSLNGGYAEYLTAKAKFCFSVNDFVDVYGSKEHALEVAAMVEPTAVAYNGMFTRGGGFAPGGNVVVFGAGPIGLSALSLARAAGAAKVISFEKNDVRIELAKKVGADYAFNIDALAKEGKTPADVVQELTKGTGAAMVVEATHHQQQNIDEMESIAAIGGTIVQVGISPDRTSIMSTYLQKKGVNYHCSIGSSGHGIWPNVIRLIAAKRIDPSLFLTGTFRLKQAIEAIKTAEKAEGGKYVVTPNR
jgi:threonine dehydrogenase-like Zn-dependent dehydrogenase